METNLM